MKYKSKDKSTVIFLVSMAVLAVGIIAFGMLQTDTTSGTDTASSDAKMSIAPGSFNFGTVSQKEGVVSTEFTITNEGSSDLIIDDMLSSCSCTSAALVVDGTEGPIFGMHNNPTNWSATLAPGEATTLNVYYDPNVHQDFRGNATREITIFSNDAKSAEKNVRVTLRQVD